MSLGNEILDWGADPPTERSTAEEDMCLTPLPFGQWTRPVLAPPGRNWGAMQQRCDLLNHYCSHLLYITIIVIVLNV